MSTTAYPLMNDDPPVIHAGELVGLYWRGRPVLELSRLGRRGLWEFP